jgi:hypothetical protein
MEELYSYIRKNRVPEQKLEYDRMIRLALNWIDRRKIKELKVFLAQEGKEYQAFMLFLEEKLGHPVQIEPELFALLWKNRTE